MVKIIHQTSILCMFVYIIVPFFDNPMFNVKYLVMHKVQKHAGAINKLSYGYASVRAKTTG